MDNIATMMGISKSWYCRWKCGVCGQEMVACGEAPVYCQYCGERFVDYKNSPHEPVIHPNWDMMGENED